MELIRGNLAIKKHQSRGKRLLLFEKVKNGFYKFLGEFEYQKHQIVEGVDSDQQIRRIIIFTLRLIS